MYKILSHCPVCSDKLKATKLKCNSCNTVIDNEFELSKFDYLNNEQLYFIETFIRCRGSIKEVEREMGISYPTVRAKLDEVIESLGYSVKETKAKQDSRDILEALENGDISVDEAISKLKE
ncbi:DUF2089 domain-containing protein [Clostridium mediterraneense]|uniref:DUF2089 domain-containing protein n=1 Tax=Clostridium mediterraneense TaxID=1805472 RepID=UPI00082CFCD2|nr:DUF2089 domain-containing protein [Clostridium mediterraneense]